MKTIKIFLTVLLFIAGTGYAAAQEMQAKKLENPNWVSVNFIKFKPGQKSKAEKIIEDYFAKADQNAGIDAPTVFKFSTGGYDYIVVWELDMGLDTFNYEVTPEDAKWYVEMGKLAGGMEGANEKMQEFFSYVESWRTELARKE